MELQSSQHFTCAPSGMGLGARVGGCSHKDWEPLACQTPELQSPKLSMELQRLSTVGEVAQAPPSGCSLTLWWAASPRV